MSSLTFIEHGRQPWKKAIDPTRSPGKKHVLTVAVEDYFHVHALNRAVRPEYWDRFESHLQRNIDETLELFDRYRVKATFFVLGWTAERQPEIVRQIATAGHEVASRGYWPWAPKEKDVDAFRQNLRRTRRVLEDAGANPILGYRCGHWISKEELWILDALAEEGYLYDSSLNPTAHLCYNVGQIEYQVYQHHHSTQELSIWEFPVSTIGLGRLRLAFTGGNYTRQLPHSMLKHIVAWWDHHQQAPLVFYFMPWELDRDQPQVMAISYLNKVRQYRNLAKPRWVLEEFFHQYEFQPIAEYLDLPYAEARAERIPPTCRVTEVEEFWPEVSAQALPVSLVIPLFNEEQNIPYLSKTLRKLRREVGDQYRFHLVLVDDRSEDGTWEALVNAFSDKPDCQIIRHEKNMGVAAAILSGIRGAPTEIVCSMDSDLSYNPNILPQMIQQLEGVDLVTASPYHPQGRVLNVPSWRLFLSKNLSRIYSLMIHERLYTFTSCVRVYRKSVFEGMELRHTRFLGVAEMLLQLKLSGGQIHEFPATLESRIFGLSKMKTAQTIAGHLGIIRELFLGRHPCLARSRAFAPAQDN